MVLRMRRFETFKEGTVALVAKCETTVHQKSMRQYAGVGVCVSPTQLVCISSAEFQEDQNRVQNLVTILIPSSQREILVPMVFTQIHPHYNQKHNHLWNQFCFKKSSKQRNFIFLPSFCPLPPLVHPSRNLTLTLSLAPQPSSLHALS